MDPETARETEWMAVDDEVYFRIHHNHRDGDLRDAASVEDTAESRPPEAGCVDDDVREEELVTSLRFIARPMMCVQCRQRYRQSLAIVHLMMKRLVY